MESPTVILLKAGSDAQRSLREKGEEEEEEVKLWLVDGLRRKLLAFI